MIVLAEDGAAKSAIKSYLSKRQTALLDKLHSCSVTTVFGPGSREDEVYVGAVPSDSNAGVAVDAGLQRLGFSVERVDPSSVSALEQLAGSKLVFVNAHGDLGECGRFQGFLDMRGIPYTGSGLLASSVCLDKSVFRRLASTFQIAIAPGGVVGNVKQVNAIASEYGFPLIAKPLRGGSSVDLRILQSRDECDALEELLLRRGAHELLLEQYIPGRDFTVGLIEWCGSVVMLPPLEVISDAGFYSEQNKMYDHWTGAVRYVAHTEGDSKWLTKMCGCLERLWNSLHLRGAVRLDFRVDAAGTPWLLEANTNPGLSCGGNLAVAIRACEMSFEELLVWILSSAAYDDPGSGLAVRFLAE